MIPTKEQRSANKEAKKFLKAKNKLAEEVLEKRSEKNFTILNKEEALGAGYTPSGEYNNFLVLEKGKVFGWFFSLEGAQKSIEAKVIKNTIPQCRRLKKTKMRLGYNTAKG